MTLQRSSCSFWPHRILIRCTPTCCALQTFKLKVDIASGLGLKTKKLEGNRPLRNCSSVWLTLIHDEKPFCRLCVGFSSVSEGSGSEQEPVGFTSISCIAELPVNNCMCVQLSDTKTKRTVYSTVCWIIVSPMSHVPVVLSSRTKRYKSLLVLLSAKVALQDEYCFEAWDGLAVIYFFIFFNFVCIGLND